MIKTIYLIEDPNRSPTPSDFLCAHCITFWMRGGKISHAACVFDHSCISVSWFTQFYATAQGKTWEFSKQAQKWGDRAPGFKRTRNHKVGNGSRGPGWNGAWGNSREGRGILKPGSRGLLLWRIRGWGQWLAERKFKASLLLQHHSKRRRRGGRRSPVVRPNCSCGSTWAVFCCLLTCWPAGLLTCRNPPFSPLGLGWPPATFSGAPSSPPRRPHLLPATPPPQAPPQLQIHPLSAPPHTSPPTS